MTTGWSARYLAYAKSHGLDPAEAMKRDERSSRGDAMALFRHWLRCAWAEYCGANPMIEVDLPPEDHVAFDAWLTAKNETAPAGQVSLFGGG